MTDQTVFWIAGSVALSLGLVWFQYFVRARPTGSRWLLATLRFIAVLGLLLLLVNPKIEQSELVREPHRLLLLYDNSSSLQDSLSRKGMEAVRAAQKNGVSRPRACGLFPTRGRGRSVGD